MDDWEWPREFWHLPPPWGNEDDEVGESLSDDDEDWRRQKEWEGSYPGLDFVSLEELEEQEEEAILDEEFDPDNPTHLYLFMDQYEYLQQYKQPELQDLIEEAETWSDDALNSPIRKAPSDGSEDDSSPENTPDSTTQAPYDGEDIP